MKEPRYRELIHRVAHAATGLFAAVAVSTALITPQPAHACPTRTPKPEFSAMYVFGDSLSDTGRVFARTQGAFPPSPYYWNGRVSNGRLWCESLAQRLAGGYEPERNFAWAGATTGRVNAIEVPGITLPGMLDELDAYLAGLGRRGRADKDALYIVFGGPNNFLSILRAAPGTVDPFEVIDQAIIDLGEIVTTLQDRGARYIAVVDLPDIGLTPRARIAGMIPECAYLSQYFNAHLSAMLDSLEDDVIRVSSYDALHAFAANPALYGFTNIVDMGLYAPTGGDSFLFWDDVHPTARAHAALARAMEAEILDAVRHGHGKGRHHTWNRPVCLH